MGKYIVQIIAPGINHTQEVVSVADMLVLQKVLNKIKKNANKILNQPPLKPSKP